MNLYSHQPFSRAILHVDGDSFFVACELTKRPELQGRPVVTGSEKGIASAMSKEAKAKGITRGMSIHKMRELCPEVIVIPSDFSLYHHYSKRMLAIIRRYTEKVEAYSIDECFADITGLDEVLHMNYQELVERIKRDLELELGITFSVGVGTTKTLAKMGSYFSKPAGITLVTPFEASRYLAECPIHEVWGIGRRTASQLERWGIKTAGQLVERGDRFVQKNFKKPLQETFLELQGVQQFSVMYGKRDDYQSMSKTQTFSKGSSSQSFIFSELSRNIERVCRQLRIRKMYAQRMSFFLKTTNFHYVTAEIELPYASAHPHDWMVLVQKKFSEIIVPGTSYRSTGVTVSQLTRTPKSTLNLFGEEETRTAFNALYSVVDTVNYKYGDHSLMLGSSLVSYQYRSGYNQSANTTGVGVQERKQQLIRRIGIPSLGCVY